MITKEQALISNGIILSDTEFENLLRDNVFRAMDEYAKAVAFSFQAWIDKEGHFKDKYGVLYALGILPDDEKFTEDELFDKYLEENP
jgi:hypothetical protein